MLESWDMLKRPKSIPSSSGVYPVRDSADHISLTYKQKGGRLLRKKLHSLPTSNGVYFFKDRRGKNLYIGKTAHLKNRLSSYFRNIPRDPCLDSARLARLTKMLGIAVRVEWQETPSEIEALILESQLIKKHRPPFNILLRDDKQYFYVVITKEKFPRIWLTHQPHLKFRHFDISSTVGPFTDGVALRATLKLLRRVFPHCTCKQTHYRRCLNAHLEKCPGYCCLKNLETYNLKLITLKYRHDIQSIKTILSGRKKMLVKDLEKEMKKAATQEDFQKAITLRNKIAKLNQVFANAKVIKEIAERGNILALMQKVFDLPALPRRIEGYDIANIQGQFATGAMVVFTNGQPDKHEYRKFKIRLNGPGDTGMLKEMLQRRFNHPEWPYPGLILVDGGKGQLNTANSVISNSKFLISKKTPIIALTKNEKHQGDHVFLSNQKEPIALGKLPLPVGNLILQVDSEAHRFAISYYRKLHQKAAILIKKTNN